MAIHRKKIELDATNQAPGRLAAQIATLLIGKHKPGYNPAIDSGDKVIILNAEKVRFTGKKLSQKVYRHHTMYPGGLKEIPASQVMAEDPTQIIIHAVEKMLPKNKLRNGRMKRLSFKK